MKSSAPQGDGTVPVRSSAALFIADTTRVTSGKLVLVNITITGSSGSSAVDHSGLVWDIESQKQVILSATGLTATTAQISQDRHLSTAASALKLVNLGLFSPKDFAIEVFQTVEGVLLSLDSSSQSGLQLLTDLVRQSVVGLIGGLSYSGNFSVLGTDVAISLTAGAQAGSLGKLLIGSTTASAFAGVGSTGVRFSNGLFGLAVYGDGTYALDASGAAAVTGVPELVFEGTLHVRRNTVGAAVSETISIPLAAGGTRTVSLVFTQNEVLRLSGSLKLGLSQFVYLQGNFAFDLLPLTTMPLSDGGTTLVTGLTVGASNVYLFAGLGGPYWVDSNNDGQITAADTPDANASGLALQNVTIGLGLFFEIAPIPARYLSLRVDATSASVVGLAGITATAKGISVGVNWVAGGTDTVITPEPAIKFSALTGGGLSVPTGGTPITLDFSDKIQRVTISDLTLQVSQFVYLRGSFALEKGVDLTAPLTGGGTMDVEAMTLGAANVYVFVGLGGPYWRDSNNDGLLTAADTPDPDAIGLALQNVSVGLGLFKEQTLLGALTSANKYTALKVTATSAAFVGGGDYFKLDAKGITIGVNQVQSIFDTVLTPSKAINFSAMSGGGFNVNTGSATPVTLDFNSRVVRASVADATVQIYQFVFARGSFAFEKSSDLTVPLIGGSTGRNGTTTVEVMTIGASNVHMFVGLGGPYWKDTNNDGQLTAADTPDPDSIGLALESVNLGLALMKERTLISPNKYTALKVTAASAGFVGGGDYFKLDAKRITIGVNQVSALIDNTVSTAAVINFASMNSGAGFQVATGGTPVTLDFNSRVVRASVADATVRIYQFVFARGSFAFEKSSDLTVPLIGGSTGRNGTTTVEVMTIGASNVHMFVGIGGPYWKDSNGDGQLTSADTPDANAIGLALESVTVGLTVMKDKTLNPLTLNINNKYTGLKVTAASAAFVGGGDYFKVEAKGITIALNQVQSSIDNALLPAPVVDFSSMNGGTGFQVATGGTPVTLDFEDVIIRASVADLTLQLSEFIYLRGSAAFEKGVTQTVSLVGGLAPDPLGSSKELEFLTIAGSHIHAFVGMRGPYWVDSNSDGSITAADTPMSGFVGLAVQDFTFGLALMKPTLVVDPSKYFALKATAKSVSLVGISGVTATARDITVELNQSSPSTYGIPLFPVVNFSAMTGGKYSINTGGVDPATNAPITVDLTMNSPLVRAEGFIHLNLVNSVYLSGNIAFELGPTQTVTLSNNTTKTVSTMSIGAGNVTAFIGANGPYWTDANGNNQVDAGEQSSSAVGFAISDFDAGLLVMVSTNLSDLGAYVALKASVAGLGLVNMPAGITANGAFDVELNLGIGTAAVNLVASFPASGGNPAGYSVRTGPSSPPMLLNFTGPKVDLKLTGTLGVASAVSITGTFFFDISPGGLKVLADGRLTLGPAGDFFVIQVIGVLVINNAGLAADIDLSINLGSAIPSSQMGLSAAGRLIINTTGVEQSVTIPNKYLANLSPTAQSRLLTDASGNKYYPIAAGALRVDGSHAPAGAYVEVSFGGTVRIFALNLVGNFLLTATTSEFTLNVDATANLLIGNLTASGFLSVRSDGVIGSLQMGLTVGTSGLGSDAFVITGTFQLEINSTNTAQPIKTLDVASDGTVLGIKDGTISANTYRLVVGGSLKIMSTFTVRGRMELKFSPDGFEVQFDATLSLGGFGNVSVRGGAVITNANGTPVFAVNLALGVNALSIPSVTVEGNFTLKVNTSSSTTYVGVAPGTVLVHIDATVRVLLFEAKGSVTVGVENGVFAIELHNLSMSFFNFITLKVNGYVRSNGQFKIAASVNLELNFGPFVVYGGFEVEFSNTRFYGRIYGGVDFSIDLGLFSISFTIASVEAEIEFTIASASAALKVTAVGFTFSGSISWSWGAPPVIATKIGSTLRLNMGVDAHHMGELYEDVVTDSYTITHVSGSAGNETVNVQAMGVKSEYSGISKIVVNDGGMGNDFIYISPGVLADVEINGGTGDDTFYIVGKGDHTINTGAGNDVVESGSGNDTLRGGSDSNTLKGGGGNDTFIWNGGTDRLEGQAGNDTFNLSGGSGTADGGDGNDTFNATGGTFTMNAGAGNDVLNLNSASGTGNGGDGNDVFNLTGGTFTITGGAGDDVLNVTGGAATINTGPDNDTINFNRRANPGTAGNFGITDNDGTDVINIDMDSTGQDTVIDDHKLVIPGYQIDFSPGIDKVKITDASGLTHIVSGITASELGSTRLEIFANRITVEKPLKAGNLFIDATQAVEFNGALTVTNDIEVRAGGGITAQQAIASSSLFVAAGQSVEFKGTLTVTNNSEVRAEGGIVAQQAIASGSLVMDAGQSVEFKGTLTIANDADVVADGGITVRNTVTARGLGLRAGQGIELFANITVNGISSGVAAVLTGAIRMIAQNGTIRTDDTYFTATQGHLSLVGVGFTSPVRSTVRYLTAVNTGSGAVADAIAREVDNLVVVNDGLALGGVYSANGKIDVSLTANDALLTLSSGWIKVASASKDIILTADDMDFKSGEDKIIGAAGLLISSKRDDSNYTLGSGGETSTGDDLSTFGADASLDLSMRDIAAFADGFSQITIGHSALARGKPANQMTLGDIEDATTIKATGQARVINAALRDKATFIGDRLSVRGDVRVIGNRAEFQARLVDINSRNFHDQNGPLDSGVDAKEVVFTASEQMVIGGWLRGDDLVRVTVPGSTGSNVILSLADGPNSLFASVGSVIESRTANSRVEVNTSKSIKIATTLEAKGANSRVDIVAGTHFTLLEGAKLVTRSAETSVNVQSSQFLHINAGSAVTAGAEFVDNNGTPVATLTGNNGDVTFNALGEVWVAGAVTASRKVVINGGAPSMPHAEYFDTIPGKLLFSTTPEAATVIALGSGTLTSTLRQSFTTNQVALAAGAPTIQVIESGKRWSLQDNDGRIYLAYLKDANNDGVAEALEIQSPHYLFGHRTFGFLLSGTITSLMDNTDLTLASEYDLIIRGNVILKGANATLTLQSDRWVYHEGFLTVSENIEVYGGVRKGGTDKAGANSKGSSVYIHETAVLNTSQSGGDIIVVGSKDVDIFGAIVPGGTIGAQGVTWAGPDSTVKITVGEQIYVDTAIIAAKSVELIGGVAGADDNRLSVVVNSAGGLTAAGLTSDNSGALVSIKAGTDFQVLGRLISGATVAQQFNQNGDRIGETFTWTTKTGLLHLEAAGQAFVGGVTTNKQGAVIETGVSAYAKSRIEIVGGDNPAGIGVKVHPASELVARDATGSIDIKAVADADIQGLLVAGGEIQNQFDPTGQKLGRKIVYFGNDSTVRVQADHQIRIGQTIRAGKQIDFIGGQDPVEPNPANGAPNYSGRGIVVYGSVRLITASANSTINLNAPGALDILAPQYSDEVEAQNWIATANGKLANDVTLDVFLDLVDFEVRGSVSLLKSATTTNTKIEDLMADLKAALAATQFSVIRTDNPSHAVGSAFTLDATTPELNVELREGRLVLAGPYNFALEDDSSVNAQLLGFDVSQGPLESQIFYAVYAPGAGSKVNIGSPTGPNGRLYIAGMVLGHSGINLYSGVSTNGSPDLELEVTGTLETLNASITLSPGANGVVKGNVIAGGVGSDVTINSARSLTIHGKLIANDKITLTAGTLVSSGEASITTTGTSRLTSTGGNGQILITGLNDVVIDSLVGPGSTNLSLIRIESQQGTLFLKKTSGWIETGALIRLLGQDLDVEGVLRSTQATAAANDFEVELTSTDDAILHGDMQFAGSVKVSAGDQLDIFNTTLRADASGQAVKLNSGGALTFGKITGTGAARRMQSALISASAKVDITPGGLLTINSGSRILASGHDSQVVIQAGAMNLIGSIYGGGTVDANNSVVWVGRSADVLITAGKLVIGGKGVDENGQDVDRGGSIQVTGLMNLTLTDTAALPGLTLSRDSFLRSDATGGGVLTPAPDSEIRIASAEGVQIYGLVESLGSGSDVNITAAGLVLIDGMVRADDQLVITGGVHTSGAGIIVKALVLKKDANGNLIDVNGGLTDADGFRVNASGAHLNAAGAVTTNPSQYVLGAEPVRLSGGVVDAIGFGNAVKLVATGGVIIFGTVGELSSSSGQVTAKLNKATLESIQGSVTITSNVNANSEIALIAPAIEIMAGAVLRTRQAGGRIVVRGNNVFVAGGSNQAVVDSFEDVDILANVLQIDGLVRNESAAGQILLNVETSVLVIGSVKSLYDIEINAGVNHTWTDAKLHSGTINRSELSAGNILVLAVGLLEAGADVRLTAGGNVNLQAGAALQNGTMSVSSPVISTEVSTIDVVTGFRDVAIGIIEVPVVTWVPTIITKQVGTEEVKVGNYFHTMDTTLTQDGYFNPAASESDRFREWFIEGLNYYNSTDYPHTKLNIPIINWSAFGASAPSSDYTKTTYRGFNDLNDVQKSAVLTTLGYKPLYNFSYSNAKKHESLDGNVTVNNWTPSWAGKNPVIYNVDVAGWKDKYIRMPEGAHEDVLRIVSQGEPIVSQEKVGTYHNTAKVLYTQINSAHAAVNNTYYRETDDGSGIRWQVSYANSGLRWYDITDGRTGSSIVSSTYVPDWQRSLLDTSPVLKDKNGLPIYAQSGYVPETSLINGKTLPQQNLWVPSGAKRMKAA